MPGRRKSNATKPRSDIRQMRIDQVLLDSKGHAYRVVRLDGAAPDDESAAPIVTAALAPVAIDESGNTGAPELTAREVQIARLLANRATNAEIAGSLGISAHTARNHSQRVLEKLGVTSRAAVRALIIGSRRK